MAGQIVLHFVVEDDGAAQTTREVSRSIDDLTRSNDKLTTSLDENSRQIDAANLSWIDWVKTVTDAGILLTTGYGVLRGLPRMAKGMHAVAEATNRATETSKGLQKYFNEQTLDAMMEFYTPSPAIEYLKRSIDEVTESVKESSLEFRKYSKEVGVTSASFQKKGDTLTTVNTRVARSFSNIGQTARLIGRASLVGYSHLLCRSAWY